MFNRLFRRFNKGVGIDLGTANTLIFVEERGIVVNEPSVVAINMKTEQILAVGREAKNMLGKTPPHIEVTRPLTHGIISDYEVTERMLKYFLDKIQEDGIRLAARPRVMVCVPLEITEVEMKAVEDAVTAAGAKEVYPVQEPIGSLVVDIGGGNTDVAVISLNGIVTWKSTHVAGDEMNRNIVQYAREVFNLLVGEQYAEQIKIKIGTAIALDERLEFPIRGRDVVSGLPKEVMITSEDVREALDRSVRAIVDHIKMTLEVTPPELTADIHERGMLLTGGGSLLRGLDQIISKHAEIPVRIADDPLTAVVRGTGILLDDLDLLKEVALPSTKDIG